jgi:hypothetical protein
MNDLATWVAELDAEFRRYRVFGKNVHQIAFSRPGADNRTDRCGEGVSSLKYFVVGNICANNPTVFQSR